MATRATTAQQKPVVITGRAVIPRNVAEAEAMEAEAQAAQGGPPQPEPVSPENIAFITDAYLRAKVEIERWEVYKASMAAQLEALHRAGRIPTKFKAHGSVFSLLDGRATISMDDEGKAQVKALQAQLLAAGHAEERQGAPYWSTREVKPSKNGKRTAADDLPTLA